MDPLPFGFSGKPTVDEKPVPTVTVPVELLRKAAMGCRIAASMILEHLGAPETSRLYDTTADEIRDLLAQA